MSVPRLTVTLERVPVPRLHWSDVRTCVHECFYMCVVVVTESDCSVF